jgi:hypothetical protein
MKELLILLIDAKNNQTLKVGGYDGLMEDYWMR